MEIVVVDNQHLFLAKFSVLKDTFLVFKFLLLYMSLYLQIHV